MSEENKQRLKEYQKNYCKAKKISIKKIFLFYLHGIKTNKKVLIFDKQCIEKNAFHRNKIQISIDKVETRRIVLSKKDLYSKKGSFI